MSKNHIWKKTNQFSSTFSSTMYLLHTLFEDLGRVTELHEKIANKDTDLHSLDPRNYLFNGQEEGDYLSGQGIINEASINDKDYLVLYKSWCLFIYREFYKNCLPFWMKSVYEHLEKNKQVFSTDFVKSLICMMMKKIQAYLMKLSNKTLSDFGLSYQTVMNNQSYTIRSGITRPCQFVLGNIPTISGITDSVGRGWDDEKIAHFFNESNNIGYGRQEVPITKSKHFEHAYIFLSTMTKIKLTTKKDKGHLFTIECFMQSFELLKETVCKQHSGMFKHDKYTFHPQKDLVLSMPNEFVANLEPGKLTSLDKLWLKSVTKIFKKA
jgi:hypothetical protein